MNKEFADRWVADLRDPNNKQCPSVLHDGVGYCCLGRALVVGGFKLVPRRIEDDDVENLVEDGGFVIDGTQKEDGTRGEAEGLNRRAMEAIGFNYPDGSTIDGSFVISGRSFPSLAEANDGGISFAEIADWVEKNWERL